MIIFILLFSTFAIYFLQSKLYAKYWNYGLQVFVEFPNTPMVEGETGMLKEVISNHKLLPLTILDVKFSCSKYITFINGEVASISDRCYKHDVFSLLSYQKITRSLPFQCVKRGYYEIEQVHLISHDLLLSKNFVSKQTQHTNLYVYPKPVDTTIISILFQKIMGELISKRFLLEDPFEFSGVRDYTPSDPINKINWSASARSANLMVNTNRSTTSQHVAILLNLEHIGVLTYEQLQEESIRIASSLCEMLIKEGISVSLITNGCDCFTKNPSFIPLGNGKSTLQQILEHLARIQLSLPMSSFSSLLENGQYFNKDSNTYYILISTLQNEELIHSFTTLLQKSSYGCWIVPKYSHIPQTIETNNRYHVFPWEVTTNES